MIEKEKILLSDIVHNWCEDKWTEINFLNESDFVSANHKKIFLQIKKSVEKSGVASQSIKVDFPKNILSVSQVKDLVKIIKNNAKKIRLQQSAAEFINSLKNTDDIEDLIGKYSSSLLEEENSSYQEVKSISDVIGDTVVSLEKKYKRKSLYDGIETGFSDLDNLTCGLRNGEMIVLGARPSIGKTALAISMLNHISVNKGHSAAFFSLEMPATSIVERLLSLRTKITSKKLRIPALMTSADWTALGDQAEKIKNSKIFIDDTCSLKISEIRAKARKLKREKNIEILFIDYMGLIQGEDKKLPRWEQMSEISRQIKAMARELNIPVIVLSQVRRDSEGKEPSLADLRETGAIEQDADVVMFLHRERDTENEIIETKLILAKQRNGAIGDIELAFIPKYAGYEGLDKKY